MLTMFPIVIEEHNHLGQIVHAKRAEMYFTSPPLVGDWIDLHTGEHQVTSRRWTKTGEIEIHMVLVYPPGGS